MLKWKHYTAVSEPLFYLNLFKLYLFWSGNIKLDKNSIHNSPLYSFKIIQGCLLFWHCFYALNYQRGWSVIYPMIQIWPLLFFNCSQIFYVIRHALISFTIFKIIWNDQGWMTDETSSLELNKSKVEDLILCTAPKIYKIHR